MSCMELFNYLLFFLHFEPPASSVVQANTIILFDYAAPETLHAFYVNMVVNTG